MTVAELKELLEKMNGNNEVVISNSNYDYSYEIGLVSELRNNLVVIEIDDDIEEDDEEEC